MKTILVFFCLILNIHALQIESVANVPKIYSEDHALYMKGNVVSDEIARRLEADIKNFNKSGKWVVILTDSVENETYFVSGKNYTGFTAARFAMGQGLGSVFKHKKGNEKDENIYMFDLGSKKSYFWSSDFLRKDVPSEMSPKIDGKAKEAFRNGMRINDMIIAFIEAAETEWQKKEDVRVDEALKIKASSDYALAVKVKEANDKLNILNASNVTYSSLPGELGKAIDVSIVENLIKEQKWSDVNTEFAKYSELMMLRENYAKVSSAVVKLDDKELNEAYYSGNTGYLKKLQSTQFIHTMNFLFYGLLLTALSSVLVYFSVKGAKSFFELKKLKDKLKKELNLWENHLNNRTAALLDLKGQLKYYVSNPMAADAITSMDRLFIVNERIREIVEKANNHARFTKHSITESLNLLSDAPVEFNGKIDNVDHLLGRPSEYKPFVTTMNASLASFDKDVLAIRGFLCKI